MPTRGRLFGSDSDNTLLASDGVAAALNPDYLGAEKVKKMGLCTVQLK
jgi:hypothetical protein